MLFIHLFIYLDIIFIIIFVFFPSFSITRFYVYANINFYIRLFIYLLCCGVPVNIALHCIALHIKYWKHSDPIWSIHSPAVRVPWALDNLYTNELDAQ